MKSKKVVEDYDDFDTSAMIDRKKPLQFEDIGLKLPKATPTQVVSIRLPTALLNEVKALGSKEDVPYQVLIKLILSEGIKRKKKRLA